MTPGSVFVILLLIVAFSTFAGKVAGFTGGVMGSPIMRVCDIFLRLAVLGRIVLGLERPYEGTVLYQGRRDLVLVSSRTGGRGLALSHSGVESKTEIPRSPFRDPSGQSIRIPVRLASRTGIIFYWE